jgi:hypothetical protein
MIALETASAKSATLAGSRSETRISPNWSPASRASVSCGFSSRRRRRVSAIRMLSPAAMPRLIVDLLVAVDVDRHDGRPHGVAGRRQRQHRLQPVEEDLAVRQAGQVVVQRVLQQPLDGILLLGHIDDRADAADDFAVRAQHRPGANLQPVEMPVLGADAKFVVQAAAAVFEQHVQRRSKTVAVVGVQPRHPVAHRPVHGAGIEPEAGRDVGRGDDAVAGHVPVPDGVAAAGQRQRLPFEVGEQTLLVGASGKGVLHDSEADQKHDQNQTAAKRRLDDVVVELAGHRQPAGEQPDQDQRPGRHQQDRAIVAVEAQIDDQQDADGAGQCEREAGDARRDRGIVDRHAAEQHQADHPGKRRVTEMHVPAVEIEVGEQEDDERRRERHLRRRAPYALVARRDGDQLVQETEIDADIGEYRPGKRCRRRQHRGALDDEENGQEHRQQARDSKHDAAIERERVDRVLVGVRLPEIDLRQRRRRELGDEGDGRTGVQRDPENVGIRARYPVERKTFRGRDRDDALRAEVRPEHFRVGEPEMRGNDHPFELFFRNVGKCKDRPVALVAGRACTHLDAAADAIRSGGRRHLEGLALVDVDIGGSREVERRVVSRDLDRLRGARTWRSRQDHGGCEEGDDCRKKADQ